jgi:hypothetical protein
MRADEAPPILAIDDADLFGAELSHLVRETSSARAGHFILLGIRSGKVDRALDATLLKGLPYYEIVIPHLTDADIGKLLDVLDRENRLGVLKGKSRSEQEIMFRSQAGRQLLVAMIQAPQVLRLRRKRWKSWAIFRWRDGKYTLSWQLLQPSGSNLQKKRFWLHRGIRLTLP